MPDVEHRGPRTAVATWTRKFEVSIGSLLFLEICVLALLGPPSLGMAMHPPPLTLGFTVLAAFCVFVFIQANVPEVIPESSPVVRSKDLA